MKVLIPILSENENDEQFIEEAIKGAKEAILLLVIDANPKQEFGFTASHIQKGRKVMEIVRESLGKKRKKSEELIEWGDTKSKILNLALLRKVDKVAMKKQENQYFEELAKKLKAEKIEVQVIEAKIPQIEP